LPGELVGIGTAPAGAIQPYTDLESVASIRRVQKKRKVPRTAGCFEHAGR